MDGGKKPSSPLSPPNLMVAANAGLTMRTVAPTTAAYSVTKEERKNRSVFVSYDYFSWFFFALRGVLSSSHKSLSLSLSLPLRASFLLIQKKSFSLFVVLPPSFLSLIRSAPPLSTHILAIFRSHRARRKTNRQCIQRRSKQSYSLSRLVHARVFPVFGRA